MKGMIQIYTGNGKGKTTAALGLALRAAGAGLKIFIGQFAKGMPYSELEILSTLPQITVRQFGRDCFIVNQPDAEDIRLAQAGLEEAEQAMQSGKYDVIILDEANIALFFKLFAVQDLLAFMDRKPEAVELVITGRYAPQEVQDKADLVTEMREIKHYYTQGVEARKGIES